MLALTVGLVLLVACANVAGLLRRARRRSAAGGRRAPVARAPAAAGSCASCWSRRGLLAALATAAGLAVAQWMLVALEQLHPPLPLPVHLDFAIDGTRARRARSALAVLTAVTFGLAPALQATRGLHHAASQRTGAVPDRARRLPLRGALVVGQVAAVGGAARPRRAVRAQPAGVAPAATSASTCDHVLVATVDPSMLDYTPERGAQLYDAAARARCGPMPGVQAASVAQGRPAVARLRERPAPHASVRLRAAGPARTWKSTSTPSGRLLRDARHPAPEGREFTAADRPGAERGDRRQRGLRRPLLAGQRSARAARHRQRTPTGRGCASSASPPTRSTTTRSEAPRPIMMLPFAQHYTAQAKLHVRTVGDPAAFAPTLREAIRSVDPALPILALGSLSERTSVSLLPQQIAAALIGTFGVVALLLSLLGLYGMLARSVAQRSREIGVRLALGAAPAAVVRLVLGQGWRLTAARPRPRPRPRRGRVATPHRIPARREPARRRGLRRRRDRTRGGGHARDVAAGPACPRGGPRRGPAKRVTFPWRHHACTRPIRFPPASTPATSAAAPRPAPSPPPRRGRPAGRPRGAPPAPQGRGLPDRHRGVAGRRRRRARGQGIRRPPDGPELRPRHDVGPGRVSISSTRSAPWTRRCRRW